LIFVGKLFKHPTGAANLKVMKKRTGVIGDEKKGERATPSWKRGFRVAT
jgi:hypothetical protein